MDQTEKEGVITSNAFEENDNMYEKDYNDKQTYSNNSVDDNTDIENVIDDEELNDWNDDY